MSESKDNAKLRAELSAKVLAEVEHEKRLLIKRYRIPKRFENFILPHSPLIQLSNLNTIIRCIKHEQSSLAEA